MKVHQDLRTLPKFSNTVLTIGSFDGVHIGHRKIIAQLVQTAQELGSTSVLITFEPHPRLVINPHDKELRLLNTLQEKILLLSELGLDHLVVVPFDAAFRSLSAEAYIREFLVANFAPACIIIGYDHHFGNNRDGNLSLLATFAEQYRYRVVEIPKQEVDALAVSSTKIRNYLLAGEVDLANSMLDSHYSISGLVVHGDARGRTIGYPTANLQVHHKYKLIPGNGVYAIKASFQGLTYGGMMNIGTRPTIEQTSQVSLEAHLFNFNQSIYDESISVQLVGKLRNELKFNGLAQLIDAIKQDEQDAKKLLNL
jgi:riboflavin kinase / FMN adenylyltransferase